MAGGPSRRPLCWTLSHARATCRTGLSSRLLVHSLLRRRGCGDTALWTGFYDDDGTNGYELASSPALRAYTICTSSPAHYFARQPPLQHLWRRQTTSRYFRRSSPLHLILLYGRAGRRCLGGGKRSRRGILGPAGAGTGNIRDAAEKGALDLGIAGSAVRGWKRRIHGTTARWHIITA